MATKINFTPEHRKELMELAGEALVNGTRYRGSLGAEMTIYDLFHNVGISTLTKFHATTKKEAGEIENLDEWSLNDYQRGKATRLKNTARLINLLIGFKRKSEEDASAREEYKKMKNEMAGLIKMTTKPEDQIKALQEKMAAMGISDAEEVEA